MTAKINTDYVKNTLYYGGITLITAGLITMFVCGILGRTGKLPILPYTGALAMIGIPPLILLVVIIIKSGEGKVEARGF